MQIVPVTAVARTIGMPLLGTMSTRVHVVIFMTRTSLQLLGVKYLSTLFDRPASWSHFITENIQHLDYTRRELAERSCRNESTTTRMGE